MEDAGKRTLGLREEQPVCYVTGTCLQPEFYVQMSVCSLREQRPRLTKVRGGLLGVKSLLPARGLWGSKTPAEPVGGGTCL